MLLIRKHLTLSNLSLVVSLMITAVPGISLAQTCANQQVVINSLEEATIASDIGGTILSFHINEGESFKKNELLLKFDCRTQEAELNKALADQKNATSALKNSEKLESYGASSKYESTKARADFEKSNAEVDRLKAVTSKCNINAPFDGTLVEKLVQAHNTVKPGEALMKIVNPNKIELVMRVPSLWLSWLTVGSKFDVYVYELDQKLPAQVENINAQVDAVSRTVKIRGYVISPNTRLLPGMTGEAIFSNLSKNIKCNDK